MTQRKRYVIVGSDDVIAGTGNDVFTYEDYDTISAFLSGGTSSSVAAYLLAGINTSGSQSAFLSGTKTYTREVAYQVVDSSDDDVDDTSNQAVVATLDTPASKISVYLDGDTGGTPADDSIPAFLYGRPASFQSAYLKGASSASSSVSAFVEGFLASTPAYLAGIERSTKSAYTEGGLPWFTKYKAITIPKPDSTLTDYPFTLKIRSDNDLRTVANGGYVQNTDSNGGVSKNLTVPCDLVFAEDKFNNSVLDFEFEYYDPATGELWAHIRIPTLSSAADTVIYMTFGNANITNTQENIGQVWPDYELVLHLAEASGTRYDSTIHKRHATPANSPGRYDGTGIEPLPIKYGADFDPSSNDEALVVPFHVDLAQMDESFTIEVWAKTDDTSPSTHQMIVGMGEFLTDGYFLLLETWSKVNAYFNGKTATSLYNSSSLANLWGLVWDQAANYLRLMRDQAQNDTYYNPGTPTIASGSPFVIGAQPDDTDERNWYGWIDEVRYYKGARTAAYFKAVHTNLISYTQGYVGTIDDVVFRGSTPAWLEGFTTGVSTTPAFLAGKDTATDSQAAFLQSGGTTTSSQSAFLQGPSPTVSSVHAYLTGPNPATDSQAAYLEGSPPPTTSTVSAWLWADWPGVPPTEKSSTHGYLEGDGTFPFSDNFTGDDGDDWNSLKWETGFGT